MENDFRTQDTWRIFRIMAEFVESIEDLADVPPAVAIFGSAREPAGTPRYERTVALAATLGRAGYNIITGGGPGIMEAANKGAREAGVLSVGLGIDLPHEQAINPFVNRAMDFRYFFVRKVMFLKYSQAVVACPGGFGTMDELFEIITLVQTRKVPRVPIVLFGKDWYGPLFETIKKLMLDDGPYISPDDIDDILYVTDSIDAAVSHIRTKGQSISGSPEYRFDNFAY